MSARRATTAGADERGAVLVIVTLMVAAIMAILAIVVDLGQLRADRRSAQTVTDVAAVAAGYHLSGRGTNPMSQSPRAACEGVINSVQTDVNGFAPALTQAERAAKCAGFPTTTLGCSSSTAPVVITRGAFVLTIRYPVPNSEIAEPRFKNGVGAEDGSNMCERMKISLQHTGGAYFAGFLGVEEQTISAGTVVRANTSALVDGVAALLLLERMGCEALQTSGDGGVVVQPSSPINPGVIQADSAGQVGGSGLCTTNSNADGYVIYGTARPASSGGGPSIVVEPAASGVEGIVAIRAIEIGGRGGAVVPTGLSPAPVGSGINSRQVADNRYNRPVSEGGNAQISTLHNAGRDLVTGSRPGGYRPLSGADCSGLNTTTNTTFEAETHIFVQCPEFSPDFVVFPAATHLIFTGKIGIANRKFLSMPVAERIYVRGCTTGCTGSGNFAIDLKGFDSELRINTVATGLTGNLACATRAGPGVEPTSTFGKWTVLATFGGPFTNAGQVRMCQTSVYLGKDTAPYSRQSVEGTGVGVPSYPAIAGCTPTRPCPSDAGGDAYIAVTGGGATGGGRFDWSAPNQVELSPTQSDFANDPFEDLALWAEATSPSNIKGQGANSTEGVFFLPNSTVTFTGQAIQSQPLNAQFVARRLNLSGQGLLFLRPSKDDAIPTRIPGAIALIR